MVSDLIFLYLVIRARVNPITIITVPPHTKLIKGLTLAVIIRVSGEGVLVTELSTIAISTADSPATVIFTR
jgi:hypothetical protein